MRLALALLIIAATLPAADIRPQSGDWLRFEVAKTGLLRGKKHVFEFPAYQGTADPQALAFDLSIESAKILLKDDWLKESDLKKVLEVTLKDMLDAARHPRIAYRSTRIEKQASGLTTQGMLNIRGIERPVEVKMHDTGAGVYEGAATIDMRHFNLKPPSAAFGAIGTDPLMKLSFRLTVR